MKNRAARGGSEGDNEKAPSTSKFHFSKGKYGNVVLAWHGVLIQKAKANFPDICAQARKHLGVTDVEIGDDNQRAQYVNPEVRTRVGLDSESESEEEDNTNDGGHEDHGDDDSEDDQNADVDYHGNNGNNDDTYDGNDHNDQNDGPSRSEYEVVYRLKYNSHDSDVDAEKNDGGKGTEEVDPGPSRHGSRGGGRRDTKA